jgi:hypothetical protein
LHGNNKIHSNKKKERYRSWLTGWAVNSIAIAIEGSNPSLSNIAFIA